MRSDVGASKVATVQKYLNKMVPVTEVISYPCRLTAQNIDALIDPTADYVVDCMNDLDSKVLLAAYCVKKKIKIISSCGAGMHSDPTWLQIRDISEVKYDQVGVALREALRKHQITRGVLTICSDEETKLVSDPFRAPCLSTYPPLVGLAIAANILSALGGTPIKYTGLGMRTYED
jgi:tRNA A37 threonylcarbamoyladenosine dehydratase